MGSIGFIALSEADYGLDGHVDSLVKRTLAVMKEMDIPVKDIGIISSEISAKEAGIQLSCSKIDGVVIFLSSWVKCSVLMAVYREIDHLPICLWGFPMWMDGSTERSTGSYVSYAMIMGVLNRLSRPFTGILGFPENSKEEINRFYLAARAYQMLKRSRIGLVGYSSMSIYPGTFDHLLLRAMIGPEVEYIDSYTCINIAEQQSAGQKHDVVKQLEDLATIRPDVSRDSLLKASGLYLALQELKRSLALDAINVKCQYEFSKEYAMTMCIPLSLANDRQLLANCEGDVLCTVSMMILHYLTNQTVAYGDAITHDGSVLKLSPCGYMPFSLGCGKLEISNFMPNCGFSGIQCCFVMKPGKVTVLRLVEDIGSYHILYFTGEGIDTNKRQGYMPALDIILDGNIERLIENYAGQHFAICYGDVSESIEVLAKMLKVKTVRI